MGSKGRVPPHLRRPLPGPGIGHPDPFAPAIHPTHGAFPPFDMLPPPEVMEQKLAAQHVEMQKLATENQRLAATHGNLRQDLAAIQHELQMLHNHVGAVKSEREQQIMGLLDKIGKMETDLQSAEPLKLELQQARADAQSLLSVREELVSRVQQLTEDHQKAHMDLQQIPALMSELDSLRQEYQHCRATYEYEKKLYNDHLESLQVMEKNYLTMATEVEKLRAELTKYADIDRRTGGAYGGYPGYNEKEASGHYSGGNDVYGAPQARGPLPGGGSAGNATATATAADGNTPVGAQPGPTAVRAGYDAHRNREPVGPAYEVQRGHSNSSYDMHKGSSGPTYDPQRGFNGPPPYEAQRGPSGLSYDAQRGPSGPSYDMHRGPAGAGYDTYRGPGYDAQRGHNYDMQRGPGYDVQRGPGYEAQRGTGYDVHRGGPNFDSPKSSGPQGQAGHANNAPYGSATPPTHAGSGFLPPPPPPQGGNPARR